MPAPYVELPSEALKGFKPTWTYSSTLIWWQFDDISFPEKGWADNPGVVLPWWAHQLILLIQGARTVELRFMEGPYALTLSPTTGDDVEVSALEWEAPLSVALPDLVHAVQDAMRRVTPAFEAVPEFRAHARSLRDLAEQLDRQLRYREQGSR
ncbi:hypothetical protein DAETH_08850 [Deinococcus aetherius]|uniref:Uncharacterized protein n=1 Tax=Deinococcus aetherius TaxID=200252 RepID=A0ABN6RGU2_9DEIO|nr:hypothetical protein [Deinococcus aetherius]BDP40916.1 hypothetical protein DAETH_08850 [Deinococcus aetherius]